MRIFPAVDILDGRCVQLVQGKRGSATVYGEPLAWAERWIAEGADALHVINLDGAFGASRHNEGLIRDLIRTTGIEIQLGGGIRSVADASHWLGTGIARVILGTAATEQPHIIRTLADEFGSERIMAGVDARGGQIAVEGWQKTAGDVLVWAERFESLGAGSLLYTNVDVEGLQQGVRFGPVRHLLERTKLPVVVAGGVSFVKDVLGLRDLGVYGAVLGSALYSGTISLEAALEVCR
ncbi:MAG: 1-(5-phosphoribosyl)-5-[(5-phosphoribosylamino)methylideneamino]imidazole-4-carboxamide isomerase [Methanoregula sp.]|nr:1-(5-phosphoribosyl)-5-[(5-phosphoribosylamino)methylideneamino]imidazole-4-carboxamide isomerase [Methanoregula sp.]